MSANQPTYKRQRFLLSFIQQLKGGTYLTYLQKLVFLYTMEKGSTLYEFIPYKYGAYSFQLTEDINILCKEGFLLKDKDNDCIKTVKNYPIETLYPIAKERGKKLICRAYREYPYYTINSEIINEIFTDKEAEKLKIEKLRYKQTNQELFTIGYEGKSVEAFINLLIRNDIRLLCDVRKNPLSRKFGFSKTKLEHINNIVGIQYMHFPELGIESDKRRSLNTKEDYQQLFNEYKQNLVNYQSQLEILYTLLRSESRIALMCFESDPEMCHRHVIREYLVNRYKIKSLDL